MMMPLCKLLGPIGVIFLVCCSRAASEPVDALQINLSEKGLASLSFNGEMLATPLSGAVWPINRTPVLEQSGRTFQGTYVPNLTVNDGKGTFTEYYDDWGSIKTMYAVEKNKLSIDINVSNSTKDVTIKEIQLNTIELTFSEIPQGHLLDAGMFGTAGGWYALHSVPFIVQPDQIPPIIEVRDTKRRVDFVSENAPSDGVVRGIGVPFTTNVGTKRSYPFWISSAEIPPGKSMHLSLSLRFGEPSDDVQSLSGDILKKFQDAYPFQVEWPSRAPIGALFLATSQKHPERNPRGWFLNAPDVDVTTTGGLLAWRQRLFKFADDSVKVLSSDWRIVQGPSRLFTSSGGIVKVVRDSRRTSQEGKTT